MTDYLCRAGHKRIAIISADKEDESIGKLRFEGYLKALEDNHIQPDEALICHMDYVTDSYSMKTGYRLMKSLLAEKQEFTAVYAIADSLQSGHAVHSQRPVSRFRRTVQWRDLTVWRSGHTILRP